MSRDEWVDALRAGFGSAHLDRVKDGPRSLPLLTYDPEMLDGSIGGTDSEAMQDRGGRGGVRRGRSTHTSCNISFVFAKSFLDIPNPVVSTNAFPTSTHSQPSHQPVFQVKG